MRKVDMMAAHFGAPCALVSDAGDMYGDKKFPARFRVSFLGKCAGMILFAMI